MLHVGVDTLPPMKADPGDRNRTSPFAFTGNRFEFRAPGSSQSISGPMVAINTIMAEAMDYIATDLETAVAAGTDFNDAVQAILAKIIINHGAAVFNGNGYSAEWQEEAASRGLLNLRTTPDALQQFSEPAIIDVLDKYKVLSNRELASRQEVYLEQYILSVHVEAKQTAELARTTILPAAQRHLGELAGIAASLKAIDLPYVSETLSMVSGLVTDLLAGVADLESALGHEGGESSMEHAIYAKDALIPPMNKVRAAADALEGLVADDLWPLPTYQEMLHIL